MQIKKIGVLVANIHGGGAAKVCSILCNEWIEMGYRVVLITFEDPGQEPHFPISKHVTRLQLALGRSGSGLFNYINNNIRRIFRVWKAVKSENPDIIVSLLTDSNVISTVISVSIGKKNVISERNHPNFHGESYKESICRRLVYPWASRLIVQTEDIRQWFQRNLHMDAGVIPNPVEPAQRSQAEKSHRAQAGRRRIITLGRLEPQKAHDRLIEAFAAIADQAPQWDLAIFGEGSERPRLLELIAARGLSDRIRLHGQTNDPRAELRNSDICVHATRYEGFPNALIEALAENLCVVATDCPGATGDILQGGKYGILVPNAGPDAIAEGLLRVIKDDALRAAMAAKAHEAVAELAPREIAKRWLNEMEAACRRSDG